jgi:hypothetical protein
MNVELLSLNLGLLRSFFQWCFIVFSVTDFLHFQITSFYFYHFLFWFIYLFLLFIYSHVHTLCHFFPCHPPPLSPLFPPRFQAEPVLPLSIILLKKRHKHNKEDKAFLLAKDSYTEIFLALLSCTPVLQPMLIHL